MQTITSTARRVALTIVVGLTAAGAATAQRDPSMPPAGAEPAMSVARPATIETPGLARVIVTVANRGTTSFRSQLRLTWPRGFQLDRRERDHPAVRRARARSEAAALAFRNGRTPKRYEALASARAALALAETGASVPVSSLTNGAAITGISTTGTVNRPKRATVSQFRFRVDDAVGRRGDMTVALLTDRQHTILSLPLRMPVEAPVP